MNLVLDDTIRIPFGATKSLQAFRRWTKSGDYPERGEYAYLSGEVWADLSMETLLHNFIKTQIAAVLSMLVQDEQLGRFIGDRMRLVHEAGGLSVEPDGTFASNDALKIKQVRFEQGIDSLEVIGSPDMVLEVVSSHSIQKDTVVLRDLYAAAGITEYWLVNPLGEELSFDILRLTAKGYAASRKTGGWMKSTVFGKSFRLEAQEQEGELPDYRLLVR
jgi:Uma2 family endonuclease